MLRWVGLGKSTSRIRIYKSAAVAMALVWEMEK